MLACIHTILVVLQHKTDGKHQRAEILLTNKIYIYTFITSACNKYEVLYLVKTTHMQVHVRSKTLYPFYSHCLLYLHSANTKVFVHLLFVRKVQKEYKQMQNNYRRLRDAVRFCAIESYSFNSLSQMFHL